MEDLREGLKSLTNDDASNFKQALRHYDNKSYPKAIKFIDRVLEHAPTHGETLALKSLVLHYTGRNEEALTTAKASLRHNLKNPACWHTMGFVYKNANSFLEASKCFQKVLALTPNNYSVLAELAAVQIQLRDLQNFRVSRHRLLTERAGFPVNWVGYALAEALNSNNAKAVSVLDSLLNSMGATLKPNELNEVFLFKLTLLTPEEAVAFIPEARPKVLDKIKLMEIEAEALLKLSRSSEAQTVLEELLKLNPDNATYHDWLGQAAGDLLGVYDRLALQLPTSQLLRRNPLKLAHGFDFCPRIDAYIRAKLKKGVPSLSNDLKSLYSNPEKVKVIESIAVAHYQSLKANRALAVFASFEPELSWSASAEGEQPDVLLWTCYFLSQHFYLTQNYPSSSEFLNEALEHTPTLPDLYMLKAKLYKRQGELLLAAQTAEEGRDLDMNDRYLSNVSAKYWLRVGDVPRALDVMAPFCKELGEELNFHEVQSLWFELEKGEAHLRGQDWSAAFSEFKHVATHFEEFRSAQFEFHSYCLRRFNLISYIEFLKFQDSLFAKPQFFRAVKGMLECKLADSTLEIPEVWREVWTYHRGDDKLQELALQLGLTQTLSLR
jgi:peptide alpha-N-acetyltransferase